MNDFENFFTNHSLLSTLFISIKTVTKYKDCLEFEEKEPDLFNAWYEMAFKRYDSVNDETYYTKGCYLPEITKIVSISYGMCYMKDKNIDRKIVTAKGNEIEMINDLYGMVNKIKESQKSYYLCGHNLSGFTIPYLLKKSIKENIKPPSIFKRNLNCKPWENNIIDTSNLWKFKGGDFFSLNIISDFLDLKYTKKLIDIDKLSEFYYDKNLDDVNRKKLIDFESKNEVNLTMQLYKKIYDLEYL